MIELDFQPLNAQKAIDFVTEGSVGGINVFLGTVRNETKGKKVLALEFEAYEKMAISELEKIVNSVSARWPVHKVAVLHALGHKKIGDLAVVIAVSAAHRDAAFQACRYIIDTLKETVPIWKKEIFADGEIWVAAHP
jgi:molybdopterin synthase catalytic subunit